MRAELLAPAGSPDILKAVINAGADAVYLGGDKFGARAYAANFNMETLLWAIDYVHLSGKKLYLTVNTLLKNRELELELYEYIKPLYEAGLDAVLVQDIGVLTYLHTVFPDLELHASTQFTITSTESARFLKSLGIKRAVVSRELSLAEMRQIHDETGIELEAFVHGALCYCYSGMCLFSSMLGGRSGNRGRCAQPCRLMYDVFDENRLIKKEQYILSMKDMCGVEDIPGLLEAGIFSLKIEGRMKQAEYAYNVTKVYSDALRGEDSSRAKNMVQTLADFGNRGGFTNSYYYRHNSDEMITYRDPSLHKSDQVPAADMQEKRLEIEGIIRLNAGETAVFEVSCKNSETGKIVSVQAEGSEVSMAKSAPASREEIDRRLRKTGDTVFVFSKLEIKMDDNIFISNGGLNQLRRTALELLYDKILEDFRRSPVETSAQGRGYDAEANRKHNKTEEDPVFIAQIERREMLQTVLSNSLIQCIYLPLADYGVSDFPNLQNDVEKCSLAGKQCFLSMPVIVRNRDIRYFEEHAEQFRRLNFRGFVVCGFDALALVRRLFPEKELIADHGVYSFNDRAVEYLSKENVIRVTAPLELNKKELSHRESRGGEVILYGRYPLMQSAGCVRKNTVGCDHTEGVMHLRDRYKALFPVLNRCAYCYNTIYNSVPTCLANDYLFFRKLGYCGFRFVFSVESKEEIKEILMDMERAITENKTIDLSEKQFTKGHFNRGVE